MEKILLSIVLLTITPMTKTVCGKDDYNGSQITCYECKDPNPCTNFTGDENYNFGTPVNCTGTDHCVKTEGSGIRGRDGLI